MPKKTKPSSPGIKTRILIADDHMVVTEGIKNAIARYPEFEVAGTAVNGREALEKVRELRPDIVLMDISMSDMNGVEGTYQIKHAFPDTKIVIFSMHSEREYVISLFREGVSGYVLKDESLEDLMLSLKTVSTGGTYFSRSVKDHIRHHMEELELGDVKEAREERNGIAVLSVRERELFPLIADGKSIKEISERMCISPKTVETHKYNIMEKLGAKSMADLTKLALKKDLIKL